ncbi:hypothetical protein HMPREF9568_01791 [Cutibacterium acnes HL013PA2]|nr:hypothetical protein HMPREF9568_01791 [Cutibacterium acnes HL013PA2]EGE93431.1 hypothetical protein HMPREF9571_01344 [Cutibacterium acnes HL043PA2]
MRQSGADQPGIDVPIPWHLVMGGEHWKPHAGRKTLRECRNSFMR